MIKNVIGAMTALSLVAVPAVASAAPATSLSAAKSVRASTTTADKNQLGGGAGVIAAVAIVAGIVAIGVIAATKDDDVDSPASR